jgi:hypothetical protein
MRMEGRGASGISSSDEVIEEGSDYVIEGREGRLDDLCTIEEAKSPAPAVGDVRQQGMPDAVVKAMAGRAGADVAARGQDKHLHYSRGVTVEEMRQASMALNRLVPPRAGRTEGRDHGRDERGRDRDSDEDWPQPRELSRRAV